MQKGFCQTSFAGYKEELPLIRASGGDLGGGSEVLIVLSYIKKQSVRCVQETIKEPAISMLQKGS